MTRSWKQTSWIFLAGLILAVAAFFRFYQVFDM